MRKSKVLEIIKDAINYDIGEQLSLAFRRCRQEDREFLFHFTLDYLCKDLRPCPETVLALLKERDFDPVMRDNLLWKCAIRQDCQLVLEILLNDKSLPRCADNAYDWLVEFISQPENLKKAKQYCSIILEVLQRK